MDKSSPATKGRMQQGDDGTQTITNTNSPVAPHKQMPANRGTNTNAAVQKIEYPLPTPSLQGSSLFQGAALLKQNIRAHNGMGFGSDSDFTLSKTFSSLAGGICYRGERAKGAVRGVVIYKDKESQELLLPGIVCSDGKAQKDGRIPVTNVLTGGQALFLVQVPKQHSFSVINSEAGDVAIGTITVEQLGERRAVTFTASSNEKILTLDFKCPVTKSALCFSPKPPSLASLGLYLKFTSQTAVKVTEYPNGEILSKDVLEVGIDYPQSLQYREFIAMVASVLVMGMELK